MAQRQSPTDLKAVAFVPMKNLRIVDDVGPGINIGPNLRLVNKSYTVSEKLTPALAIHIGTIDTNFLKQCPAVLIFDGCAALPNHDTDGSEHVFLLSLLAQASFLGFALWLHRSNAIHADEAYVQWWNANRSYASRIGGRERAYLPDGSFDVTTEYTAKEARESRDLIVEWDRQAGPLIFAGHPMAPHSEPHDTPRLHRFRSAVSAARCEWSRARRIALWITALESLLSSGSSELTHRLSERAAVCAATERAEHLAVYNSVKDAYRVRSAVVHGDKAPKKLYEEIPAISVAIEDIVRRSFNYVISDKALSEALFSDESSRIDSQFLDQLFAARPGGSI